MTVKQVQAAAKANAKRGSKSAARPVAAKRARASNFNAPRWTDAEIATLRQAVEAASTARAGFEVAASRLGKSATTCQQKYYSLKRKQSGGRVRTARKPARTASARRAPRARIATATGPKPAVKSSGSVNVAVMSNVELSKLVVVATAELQKRMVELETNVRNLLG